MSKLFVVYITYTLIMINFKFDKNKAITAILYITKELNGVDLHKISKILFYADQKHLTKYGRPIIGDNYIAMPNGPVPSEIYNSINAVRYNNCFSPDILELNKYITVNGYNIEAKEKPDIDEFSDSDIECLNKSIKENKDLNFDQLTEKSHGEAYLSATLNGKINLEEIAKEGGANNAMLNYISFASQNSRIFC